MNDIGLDQVRADLDFNFKHVLNNDEDEDSSIYNTIGHTCEYFEVDEFTSKVSSINKQISFFAQNIRSLPGKWTEFSDMIDSLNSGQFKFTVVSVTEVWNIPPNVQYALNGYRPLSGTNQGLMLMLGAV